MQGSGPILALDIGTTSAKAVLVEPGGEAELVCEAAYPMQAASARAELDCEKVLAAVVHALEHGRDRADSVRAVALSSAMHTLIALDGDDRPLTPCWTWAHDRARAQAARLHRDGVARDLHARTGMPVHACAPLVKILWLRENDPRLFARARRFVSIKEFVLRSRCGSGVVDHAVAAASGMLDLETLDWDRGALDLAGVDPDRLGTLVPATEVLDPGLLGAPTVVGATDGVLANLGLGATEPGVLAASLGTSGAVRGARPDLAIDPHGRLFCYPATAGLWIVGGAIHSAGIVLEWLARLLLDVDPGDAASPTAQTHLLRLAAEAPPGADGLVVTPFLAGERFARYRPDARGAVHGLGLRHGRAHLARATLEGMLCTLRAVERDVESALGPAREVRLAGGLARSPFLRQMVADVLGRPVTMPATEQGSALGAALLAARALGDAGLPPAPPVHSTHDPDPRASRIYDELARAHARCAHSTAARAPR